MCWRTFLTRAVTIFDPADSLADTDWPPHVAAIIADGGWLTAGVRAGAK